MPTSLTRIRFGFEIQALTDFLCSNKIEILNVAGRRESGIEGARRLRVDADYVALFLDRAVSRAGSTETARE